MGAVPTDMNRWAPPLFQRVLKLAVDPGIRVHVGEFLHWDGQFQIIAVWTRGTYGARQRFGDRVETLGDVRGPGRVIRATAMLFNVSHEPIQPNLAPKRNLNGARLSPTMSFDPYRQWLAALDDTQLSSLLHSRPDTALPPPPGIAPLAGRLQLRASVARALRRLTALELAALETAADLGAELTEVSRTTLVDTLASHLPAAADRKPLEDAVDKLYRFGIFYGDLRLVKEAMPALPTGWHLLGSIPAGDIKERVDDLAVDERRVLSTLANAGGVGHRRDAASDADPTRPIPRLLAGGLLERIDSQHVRLPRAVFQVLRGQTPSQIPLMPRAGTREPDPEAQKRCDASGAAQGFEFSRRVARLLELLGTQPATLNKDGRPPARLASSLAKALDTNARDVSALVAIAYAAGLLGMGLTAHVPEPLDPDANYLAPTREADAWLQAPLADKWSVLIDGWLSSPWAHWHEGRLLSDDQRVDSLPERRHHVMAQYTRQAPGHELSDAETVADTRFAAPLATEAVDDGALLALIAEARELGVIVRGCATSLLRALLAGEDTSQAAHEHAPAEVQRVIVQADMTIMAPGPLPASLQDELELFAELETPGLASMYRITEASVGRALDAGRTPEDITGWLRTHALGEIPQSVDYLVDDVARRHGTLRGGVALSYLRCADESLLAEVLHSPAAGEAQLRFLAPTVAVSSRSLAAVMEVLRRSGFQPVPEDESGATVDVRAEPARAFASPQRSAGRRQQPNPGVDDEKIAAAVSAIRRHREPGEAEPELVDHVAVLQAAARGGRPVTITAVDKSGRSLSATVKPLTVSGGQVDGLNESTGQVHRFLVHRITEVSFN